MAAATPDGAHASLQAIARTSTKSILQFLASSGTGFDVEGEVDEDIEINPLHHMKKCHSPAFCSANMRCCDRDEREGIEERIGGGGRRDDKVRARTVFTRGSTIRRTKLSSHGQHLTAFALHVQSSYPYTAFASQRRGSGASARILSKIVACLDRLSVL